MTSANCFSPAILQETPLQAMKSYFFLVLSLVSFLSLASAAVRPTCDDGTKAECHCFSSDGPNCKEERCIGQERKLICNGVEVASKLTHLLEINKHL